MLRFGRGAGPDRKTVLPAVWGMGEDIEVSVVRVLKKFNLIFSPRQKMRMAELVILMIIGGFLEMCSMSLIIPFMNVIMTPDEVMKKWYAQIVCKMFGISSAKGLVIVLSVILAVIYVLKNIYLVIEYSVQFRFVYNNMFMTQKRILDSYIHRPYEYFLKASSAELIRVVNSDTPNTFNLLTNVLGIITELVVSLMLTVSLFMITPVATAGIAGILAVLMLVINATVKPMLARAGRQNQKYSAGVNKWLLQSIEGIKEIKIMSKEEFFQKCYDDQGMKLINVVRKEKTLSMTPRYIIEAVSMAVMFITLAALVYGGISLEGIIPVFSAVAMAAFRLLPSVNRVSGSLASVSYFEPMLDKLLEVIKETNTENKKRVYVCEKSADPNAKISFQDKICFQDITFTYPDAPAAVLTCASMVIHKGESVGIVGSSGSGKTTSVDIILGLLKPQSGHVYADGNDILSDTGGWHDEIGYIPQSIFMLDSSIRSNVAFGVDEEDISDEKVWNALKKASLDEYVRSLPKGLDTKIGERGIRISGGQRQRIGIARALYRDPEILVFDEATSSLDNETEAAIIDSINELHGQKTMLIIAHRLSTIRSCDTVYRVENGRIVHDADRTV